MQIMIFASKISLLELNPLTPMLVNKSFGFGLKQYKTFCPINIPDDPCCLDFVYKMEN